MRPVRGVVLKEVTTDYHILDVMRDRDYLEFFLYRFKIAVEVARAKYVTFAWLAIYGNNPELLYKDAIDSIECMLDKTKISAAIIPLGARLRTIVLPAVGDWIVKKTGRDPPFEIFPNTAKSARDYNFEVYAYRKQNKTESKS